MKLASCSLTQMMRLARLSLVLLPLEFRFSPGEGDVSKSNHVLYLSLHCDAEEGNEVHDQDGPEDRDVEELPEGTEECNRRGLGGGVPELELGQPPDEGPELLVLVGRKHVWTIFISIQLCHCRIYFGSEEGQEKIKMVDCKSIGHDVPTLGYHDPANEGAEEQHRGHPPAGGVGGPPVEHQLVGLSQSFEESDHHVWPLPQDILPRVFHHL